MKDDVGAVLMTWMVSSSPPVILNQLYRNVFEMVSLSVASTETPMSANTVGRLLSENEEDCSSPICAPVKSPPDSVSKSVLSDFALL